MKWDAEAWQVPFQTAQNMHNLKVLGFLQQRLVMFVMYGQICPHFYLDDRNLYKKAGPILLSQLSNIFLPHCTLTYCALTVKTIEGSKVH